MLVHTDVPLALVVKDGKDFNWNRPSCNCGGEKVWGHGYVARFFAGIVAAVLLKRYRCPNCRRVFIMMPEGYAPRYQTPARVMCDALASRLMHRGWPRGLPRQRGWHWLRKFLAICRMDFPEDDLLTVLARLRGNGVHLLDQF